jgi:DNA-binding beta-propeller fold protein YncE
MFWSVVLVLTTGGTGRAQVSMSTGMNYEKVALKKWYVANQVTTFLTGPFSLPLGIQFDGANIWVTNSHDNTVIKLRAADGAKLGTFSTGNSPHSVAFDGANIWVTNLIDSTVSVLRAADGTALAAFPVAPSPFGIVFDGVNIWVTSGQNNTVSKLRADTGGDPGHLRGGEHPV